MANLDTTKMQKIEIDNGDLYTLIAWSKSLKQMVRLVIWYSKEGGKKPKLFFSTDPEMSGKDVIEYYRTRFQIEFCFRDAKGFTGLMHSQARDVANYRSTLMHPLPQSTWQRYWQRKEASPFRWHHVRR